MNCGTMCPFGERLVNGEGSLLRRGQIVCHALLIEGADGLTLLDTGLGTDDVRNPRRLGLQFKLISMPRFDEHETAVAQVRALGFDPRDVRRIVVTHLDVDHAGGLGDFPEAEVHVFAREHEAAMSGDRRYLAAQWAHNPRWVTYETEGDEWLGFESVRVLPGLDTEVLMIPLPGHSRGHTGIALRTDDGWLLHCGDAYFHHREAETPPHCPPGLQAFQMIMQADGKLRRENQERLRELARRHADEVTLICSHDPVDLERFSSVTLASAPADA